MYTYTCEEDEIRKKQFLSNITWPTCTLGKKNKQTNIPAIKYRTSIDRRIIIIINIEHSKLSLHLNRLKADSYLSFTISAFEQATLLCLSYKNSTGPDNEVDVCNSCRQRLWNELIISLALNKTRQSWIFASYRIDMNWYWESWSNSRLFTSVSAI